MRHAWGCSYRARSCVAGPGGCQRAQNFSSVAGGNYSRDRSAGVRERGAVPNSSITFQIHPLLTLNMKAEQQFDALQSGS